MITMMTPPPLIGGLFEDMESEDEDLGPMPDESEDQFLRVLIPHTPRSAGTGQHRRLTPHRNGGVQCDTCGFWFGVTFWTCAACAATGAWKGRGSHR
ncbi:hypothetical protein AB0919_23165 [Streptomyces sp. NPDC046994]|uniref:hypothetical protein n=1 Tax=Streptomyces sp. NPDC046994 TaxID=3155735 RepID=UPI0034569189